MNFLTKEYNDLQKLLIPNSKWFCIDNHLKEADRARAMLKYMIARPIILHELVNGSYKQNLLDIFSNDCKVLHDIEKMEKLITEQVPVIKERVKAATEEFYAKYKDLDRKGYYLQIQKDGLFYQEHRLFVQRIYETGPTLAIDQMYEEYARRKVDLYKKPDGFAFSTYKYHWSNFSSYHACLLIKYLSPSPSPL